MIGSGDCMIPSATLGASGEAVAAANLLVAEGKSVRVVDVHTIKPLDDEAICTAADLCRIVLTLEEHSVIGGLGGVVAEACLSGGARVERFLRLGVPDRYPDMVGDQSYLRGQFGLDRIGVVATLRRAFGLT